MKYVYITSTTSYVENDYLKPSHSMLNRLYLAESDDLDHDWPYLRKHFFIL